MLVACMARIGAFPDSLHNARMKRIQTVRGVVLRPTPGRPMPPPLAGSGPGIQARVRVGREAAGRGGKVVSVITGLPIAGAELETLARRMNIPSPQGEGFGDTAQAGDRRPFGRHSVRTANRSTRTPSPLVVQLPKPSGT